MRHNRICRPSKISTSRKGKGHGLQALCGVGVVKVTEEEYLRREHHAFVWGNVSYFLELTFWLKPSNQACHFPCCGLTLKDPTVGSPTTDPVSMFGDPNPWLYSKCECLRYWLQKELGSVWPPPQLQNHSAPSLLPIQMHQTSARVTPLFHCLLPFKLHLPFDAPTPIPTTFGPLLSRTCWWADILVNCIGKKKIKFYQSP